MAAVGRNQPCPCGSGAKAKRCCGIVRGPSETELAKAFVHEQCDASLPTLRRAMGDADDLAELYRQVTDLPYLDLRLQIPLPALLSPQLVRLRSAVAGEDADAISVALPSVLAQVDTPVVRARLARAVVALREERRIPPEVAAAALLDLDSDADALVREALLVSLAVDCGVAATPSGLLLAG